MQARSVGSRWGREGNQLVVHVKSVTTGDSCSLIPTETVLESIEHMP